MAEAKENIDSKLSAEFTNLSLEELRRQSLKIAANTDALDITSVQNTAKIPDLASLLVLLERTVGTSHASDEIKQTCIEYNQGAQEHIKKVMEALRNSYNKMSRVTTLCDKGDNPTVLRLRLRIVEAFVNYEKNDVVGKDLVGDTQQLSELCDRLLSELRRSEAK